MSFVSAESQKSARLAPIRLRYDEQDRTVLISSEDNDLMQMQVAAAIEACRAYGAKEDFKQQFHELLPELMRWVRDHSDQLQVAHLTVRDNGLLFLVMQKETAFQSRLSDALTDLDLKIAGDERFSLIRLEVLSVPKVSQESLTSFCSSQTSFEFWRSAE